MDRIKLEAEMVKMGFHMSNSGFRYIVDAVELIVDSDWDGGMMNLYATVGEKHRKRAKNVERSIRHSIERMYDRDRGNRFPVEFTPDEDSGKLPAGEFLTRMALVMKEGRWAK